MSGGRRLRAVVLRCVLGGGLAGLLSGVLVAGVLFAWSVVALLDGPEGARPALDLGLLVAVYAGVCGAVLGVVGGAVLGLSTAAVRERWNDRWRSPGLMLAVAPPLAVIGLGLAGIGRAVGLPGAGGSFFGAWAVALVGVLVVHHRVWRGYFA